MSHIVTINSYIFIVNYWLFDITMDIEYRQWKFICKELYIKIYEKLHVNESNIEECRNAIGYWLQLVNQGKLISKYQYYPILPETAVTENGELSEIGLRLATLIEKKQFFKDFNRRQSYKAVTDILKYIQANHNEYICESFDISHRIDDGIVYFGDFKSEKSKNLTYFFDKIDTKDWNEMDIVSMVLRYESLGNQGFQWSDPSEYFDCLYYEYDVRYEGFSSPINSRLLTLPDTYFCSLFPDIDKVFGSIGDFFDIELSDYPSGWTVNPPFVEEILDKTSAKIIEALDSGVQSTFFCTFPYWPDNIGWKNLNESDHNIKSFHRRKGIVLHKAYGKLFAPRFAMSTFCLSLKRDMCFKNIEDIFKKKLEDFY